MNLFWPKTKAFAKAVIGGVTLPFKPLLPLGDSSPYFGAYEGQRYGPWDTDTCWDFSFTEVLETRLNMLEKMGLIPQDTLDWASKNGYKDADGDWYLSRRWEGILSGVKDNGNFQINAAYLAAEVGVIPNSMLPYSVSQAYTDTTRTQFVNDYFNPAVITPAMRALGLEFLKRFAIQAEDLAVTPEDLMTYLTEGSMAIGIPAVPLGWNQQKVDYPVGHTEADHAVELYYYDPTNAYPYFIYDSYEPHLKQLSKNYYIPYLTRIVIQPIQVAEPVPLPQFSPWMKFWMNAKAWLTKYPIPFPDVPLGGV